MIGNKIYKTLCDNYTYMYKIKDNIKNLGLHVFIYVMNDWTFMKTFPLFHNKKTSLESEHSSTQKPSAGVRGPPLQTLEPVCNKLLLSEWKEGQIPLSSLLHPMQVSTQTLSSSNRLTSYSAGPEVIKLSSTFASCSIYCRLTFTFPLLPSGKGHRGSCCHTSRLQSSGYLRLGDSSIHPP